MKRLSLRDADQLVISDTVQSAEAMLGAPGANFRENNLIMERLLERGTWDQVRWLFAAYGEDRVAAWVQRHGFRLLSRRSFALWRLALDITDFDAPEWAIEARKMEPW